MMPVVRYLATPKFNRIDAGVFAVCAVLATAGEWGWWLGVMVVGFTVSAIAEAMTKESPE